MSKDYDLSELLDAWPYDPDNELRIVQGEDGRELLQVRLPLGLEQYELEGRPDGARPFGKESVLEHHLARLAEAKAAGGEAAFALSSKECEELFTEGTLYYFRYLHCFQLHHWPRTARDTERNLKLFDFVHRYAAREEDRQTLEKWRPYLVRMNAAARALMELDQLHHELALQIARAGIGKIEALDDLDDDTFRFERERSLAALRELVAQIEKTKPVSETERLEKELKRAVAAQEFERAVVLRDRLRSLRGQKA